MVDHDHGYKLLFSAPRMVEDLIRGFVREPWVEQLDFSTLERVSSVHLSEDLRERVNDMVWRVRLGQRWLYLYIILEFQSSAPWDMAVRIACYVSLLLQELIRSGRVGAGERLPPVLPLVLYNGERRWTAAEDIHDLMDEVAPELARYQPRQRYLLIDEGRYGEQELAGLRNFAAALFRLELSRSPDDVRAVLEHLIEWLEEPELPEIKRAFVEWLQRVLLPGRLPGTAIPEVGDLGEVREMLSNRVREWTRSWVEQGREEGLQQGMQQGMQQGREEGLQQGEALFLMRLLEARFGELPGVVRERIEAASQEQRLRWASLAFTSSELTEVFEGD
jgi:predicted transposase YdaD